MRALRLTLVPLAGFLLACTGFCSGLLEKLGIEGVEIPGGDPTPPEGFQCTVGQLAGGAFPDNSDRWWRLADTGSTADKLKKFWDFPGAWAGMKEGDAHWYCDSAGKWSGPYERQGGDPEGWVKGYYENGDPHGTWKGGAGSTSGEEVAFEGPYSYGKKSGGWTFYNADGEVVTQGSYREDMPHGDWTYTSDTAEHLTRYIYGVLHGLWREADPKDKSLKTGSYFNGNKHGVWIEQAVDAESGQMKEVKREVWENGVSRGADGRDPMEGEDGARETLRAYLDADLVGGRLSTDGYKKYAVLGDFADETQFDDGEPAYDRAVITEKYTILSISLTGTTAKAKVAFDEQCEIVAGDAVESLHKSNEVEFTLKQKDGFWRLDTPATVPHPSGKAYLDAAGGRGSDLARDLRDKCFEGDKKDEKDGEDGGDDRERPGEGKAGGKVGGKAGGKVGGKTGGKTGKTPP